jgi:tripartite-type tricarboxylate transporter receptor subunit TctC
VDRLQGEIARIIHSPDFAARLNEQGLKGIASTPAEFAATIRSEQAKWRRLVEERKLSLE